MAGEIYTITKCDESKVKMGKSCVIYAQTKNKAIYRELRSLQKKIVIYRWIKEYGL